MSEHWKSTPKYWCKHCTCYVRDTKLEKQNHEATARHQGALKRFLRDLHRGHEREERDKERARQEIDRLNGVVGTSVSALGPSSLPSAPQSGPASETQLKKQREQLAVLGVAMPDTFRPEMAIVGDWTVTNTRIIEDKKLGAVETKATGVRKREGEDDEVRKEEEDALQNLFTKRRKWGRDTKMLPQEEDAELDALLSGSVLKREAHEENGMTKMEEALPKIKEEGKPEGNIVKNEPDTETQEFTIPVKTEVSDLDSSVKTEGDVSGPAPIIFKKRKAKGGMRQK